MNILLINDGNRRWAKEKNLPLKKGCLAMAQKLAFVADTLSLRGIKKLYFTVCSTRNLQRPPEEVCDYLEAYLLIPNFSQQQIKVVLHGNLNLIPEIYRTKYRELQEKTADYTDFTLHYMVAWSIEDEIARIFNTLQEHYKEINENILFQYADLPEKIDLIIRTGKRRRLSSFVPFHSPYAEIYFMDILFPEISEKDIDEALQFFEQQQQRTYGR